MDSLEVTEVAQLSLQELLSRPFFGEIRLARLVVDPLNPHFDQQMTAKGPPRTCKRAFNYL